jgi:hypothetical protein
MANTIDFQNTKPAHVLPSADQNGRLLDMVGELLLANQELRFQVAQLEEKVARTSRTLDETSAIYGLLLP